MDGMFSMSIWRIDLWVNVSESNFVSPIDKEKNLILLEINANENQQKNLKIFTEFDLKAAYLNADELLRNLLSHLLTRQTWKHPVNSSDPILLRKLYKYTFLMYL